MWNSASGFTLSYYYVVKNFGRYLPIKRWHKKLMVNILDFTCQKYLLEFEQQHERKFTCWSWNNNIWEKIIIGNKMCVSVFAKIKQMFCISIRLRDTDKRLLVLNHIYFPFIGDTSNTWALSLCYVSRAVF